MFARILEFVPKHEKKDGFIKVLKNDVSQSSRNKPGSWKSCPSRQRRKPRRWSSLASEQRRGMPRCTCARTSRLWSGS